jgi:alpha-L-fucosidase 2
MVFGGVERERIQFNEDSLWTGDENPSGNYDTMGAYQNFGDLFLELGGDSPASGPIHPNAQPCEALTSEAGDYMRTLTSGEALGKSSTPKDQAESNYKRSLSLGDAVARVVFKKDGVTHTRETFASYPDQVIAIRWSADRPGALSGRSRLQGAHGEKTAVEGDTFGFAGKLSNGLEYEARARAIVKGGALKPDGETLQLDKCDEVVVLLALGTNYAMDYVKHWRGDNPAERVRMQLDTASKQSGTNCCVVTPATIETVWSRHGRVGPERTGSPGQTDRRAPEGLRRRSRGEPRCRRSGTRTIALSGSGVTS